MGEDYKDGSDIDDYMDGLYSPKEYEIELGGLTDLSHQVDEITIPKISEGEEPEVAEAVTRTFALIELKKADEALKMIQDAIRRFPTNPTPWKVYAYLLCRMKKAHSAIQIFEEIHERVVDDFWTLFFHGVALFSVGKQQEAAVKFAKVCELDPTSIASWFNSGKVLYSLGQIKKAEWEFKKAIELAPDESFPNKFKILGLALLRDGDVNEAIIKLEKAIQLDSQNSVTWYNLGIALARQNKW
ncbi:MAG: tetratricopeptide repeat protein [Candidatus Heimdallarchaeota archaeon]